MTYETINADIRRLHQHYNISPSSIEHYKVITQYLNITFEMLDYDSSTEGNFVFQTEEWRQKNYHTIDNMLKVSNSLFFPIIDYRE